MNAPALPFPVNEKALRQMSSRLGMAAFMGYKLPLGLMAGLRVESVSPGESIVSVPFGWRSQNPFRSIYFAAQAMAAEMSTGLLGMLAVQSAPESVAILITGMEASSSKGTGRTYFQCTEGIPLFEGVAQTLQTGEGVRSPCSQYWSPQGRDHHLRILIHLVFSKAPSATGLISQACILKPTRYTGISTYSFEVMVWVQLPMRLLVVVGLGLLGAMFGAVITILPWLLSC